jgi:hypothetical protein
MGDPLVLDDAAQLQAELDGAERQSGVVGLEGILDDATNLLRRLVELAWWSACRDAWISSIQTRISGWRIRKAPRCLAPLAEYPARREASVPPTPQAMALQNPDKEFSRD